MAVVKPFKAYRPASGMEPVIAALPYDVFNRKEAREEVQKHPDCFLAIDRPETQFPEDTDIYAECVYEKAAEMLHARMADKSFVQDPTPCYYIYEQTMNGRSQTGITACASIDDYLNNVIRKHENTREEKEQDRIRHVDTCSAQTGPIFLAYRNHPVIDEITRRIVSENKPYCDFISAGNVRNRAFLVNAPEDVAAIEKAFSEVERIYIADGHHRCASAVKVGLKRRAAAGTSQPDAEYNYFLSVLFPENELMIMDYNRLLRNLNGHSAEEILSMIREKCFTIREETEAVRPHRKGEFGLLLGDCWYRLQADPKLYGTDPVENLDVSVLQKNILEPIFGIQDPRTDAAIDFAGGIRGLKELERRCSLDCKAAFSMYPTSIAELFAVADAEKLMPPKSTWFEPKLLSGLFIHEI